MKAIAYGGVVFNDRGEILLREVTCHFGGYVWTFSKGRQDPGETPEQTALREVREETGIVAEIVGRLPEAFEGDTTITHFFLMKVVEDRGDFHRKETQAVRWVNAKEAKKLIQLTTSTQGRKRDLAVLKRAFDFFG
jgi:mutator protein MutT